jgi:polyhydroxyalkanoate synthesis regulator phasin
MDPDTLFQMIQKGFRVGVGATTVLVEGLQNPQTLQQNLDQLRTDPDRLLEEFARKGESTEQQARVFVDAFVGDRMGTRPASEMTITTTAVSVTPDVQTELQELTQQLVALRQELVQLKANRSTNQ